MKRLVILVIFLVVFISFSYGKVVNIPSVGEGEEIPLPLVQEDDEIIRYYYSGNSLLKSSNGEESKFYYQDRLGSNRVSVNKNGEVSNFKSLPYGQVIQEGIQYGFTGKEKDESGLHYFGARYYDSDLGRFTSVDPVSSNEPYSYVSNNPMMFVDPTGMTEKPLAIMMYNSNSPEFKEEIQQYMSNYQYDYEFWLYGVNGDGEVSADFSEINQQIEAGRDVARVNYFDHRGSVMFGMKEDGWSGIEGLTYSSNREVIMGTCGAGDNPSNIFRVMTRKAGSDSYYGTKGSFYGISRNPSDNDLDDLLSSNVQVGSGIIHAVSFSDPEELHIDGYLPADILDIYESFIAVQDSVSFIQGRYGREGFVSTYTMSVGSDGIFSFDWYIPKIVGVYPENILEVGVN